MNSIYAGRKNGMNALSLRREDEEILIIVDE
jgi:hypothetical protein